jgi:hypothetical protein
MGSKLKTGVSVLTIAAIAFAPMANAGPRSAVKPPKEILNQKPSDYGQSGAQGINLPNSDVKVNELPELANYSQGASPEVIKNLPEELRRTARPGQCFTRLLKPPVIESFKDKQLVSEARSETRQIPAVTRLVDRQVLVTPERVERKVIPATTRTVLETETVAPASYREEVIPAEYETVSERRMVRPERTEWFRSEGIATGAALVTPIEHRVVRYRADGRLSWPSKIPVETAPDQETADYLQDGSAQTIWCLKHVPAEFETISRQQEVRPASVRRIEIPAKTRMVKRTITDRAEQVVEHVIPATYRTEKVREIVTPARTETYEIPAVFKDVEKARAVEAPQPVWREVLCEKNLTASNIKQIQNALALKGYDPGVADGQLGTKTVAAMQRFQADQGLAQGQISVESVRALGVVLN